MVTDYQKIELFGKTFVQKIDLKAPFHFAFPVAEQACFLYMLKGETQFQSADNYLNIPTNHALLLNCIESGKQLSEANHSDGKIVIVTFHPDTLKRIYDRELPLVFQKNESISNQFSTKVNNDFLIQKYIEGLLFYFENPTMANDEILVLKLKEIILLLSQTQDAQTIKVILSQLFSPTTYTFKQIIEANLFVQTSVEELAQRVNLSVSSFKREFKKLYLDTPANYIKTKRLERAAELLLISDQRITEIAFTSGFNDLANFTKSFHEHFKVSPSNYRLRLNNAR